MEIYYYNAKEFFCYLEKSEVIPYVNKCIVKVMLLGLLKQYCILKSKVYSKES